MQRPAAAEKKNQLINGPAAVFYRARSAEILTGHDSAAGMGAAKRAIISCMTVSISDTPETAASPA